MKIGLCVFTSNSGLGNQCRRLLSVIKPSRLFVIDSSSFSPNSTQHFDWYEGFESITTKGFPTKDEVNKFLDGLTHIFFCETPLNWYLVSEAQRRGIKVIVQSNYEFCDNLNQKSLPVPDVFLMPSYWKLGEMKERFANVKYLPPPIDPNEFKEAREINFKREGTLKLLHIVGTVAIHDRNGTLDLLASLNHTQANFELTIRSQRPLPTEYMVNDYRVRYVFDDVENVGDMYKDYDAMIFPRRFGGLALTCNEAMMSGLPVIMPDISPNNELLPVKWLVPAMKFGEFMTKSMIDLYRTDIFVLAKKIEWLIEQDLPKMKMDAFELAYNCFSPTMLQERYNELWI